MFQIVGSHSFAYEALFKQVYIFLLWCCLYDTHTHTRLMALCLGLPGWASTRKAKPIWILLKQETVSGSGISWAIFKSAPRSRQITTPAPHYSCSFTGRMPFLPPNQQRQSTEGICCLYDTQFYIAYGAVSHLPVYCSSPLSSQPELQSQK